MLPVKKIAYNTIIQLVGKAINTLIGVFAIAFLTRYLKPEGFGEYTIVLSFLQIFAIFFDFGLYLVLLQEISKKDIDKNYSFSNVVTLRIVSGILFFGLIPIVSAFFPYPTIVKQGILLTSLAFFLNSLAQVYASVFQKEMRMDKVTLAETISKIFFLLAIVFFVYLKVNLLIVLLANVVNSLVFFVMMHLYSKKYVKFHWSFDFVYWKKILVVAWPIAITTILNLIYFKADTLILSLFRSQADVGIYGASYKILEVLTALPHLILGLVLPIFTLCWFEKRYDDLNAALQKIFNLFVVVTFLIIAIFTAESMGIINFIAGAGYEKSSDLLKILIWPSTIIFFSSFFNYGIIAIQKQREAIKIFLYSAIIALIGYFVFIPKFSYFGAAYMTFFVEFFMAVFSYFLLKKYTNWKINFTVFFKVALIAIFVFAILSIININFALELILGTAIYFALIVVFRIFSKETLLEIFSFKK